jgi:hypothetical protein
MALTYEESAALMADLVFRDRVKVACLKYANYIVDEAPSTPAHNTRIKWAHFTMTSPENTVNTITPSVVMDGQVQADGAGITDALLQTSVEATVNKLL